MTNLEKLRNLPAEELAPLLVQTITVNEGDEDYDGNITDCYMEYYLSPDKEDGWFVSFEDAKEATVEWLNKEPQS